MHAGRKTRFGLARLHRLERHPERLRKSLHDIASLDYLCVGCDRHSGYLGIGRRIHALEAQPVRLLELVVASEVADPVGEQMLLVESPAAAVVMQVVSKPVDKQHQRQQLFHMHIVHNFVFSFFIKNKLYLTINKIE